MVIKIKKIMSEIYWFAVVSNFRFLLNLVIAVSVALFIGILALYAVAKDTDCEDLPPRIKKLWRSSCICFVASFAIYAFIPSEADLHKLYDIYITKDTEKMQYRHEATSAKDTVVQKKLDDILIQTKENDNDQGSQGE